MTKSSKYKYSQETGTYESDDAKQITTMKLWPLLVPQWLLIPVWMPMALFSGDAFAGGIWPQILFLMPFLGYPIWLLLASLVAAFFNEQGRLAAAFNAAISPVIISFGSLLFI